jgi:hypothetical protein
VPSAAPASVPRVTLTEKIRTYRDPLVCFRDIDLEIKLLARRLRTDGEEAVIAGESPLCFIMTDRQVTYVRCEEEP